MSLPSAASPTLPIPAKFVLPLIESRQRSPSAWTFRFSTEGTSFEYRSNQAIRLSLPGVNDPWGAVRTFSLSSSPTELGSIAVTCRISDTPFKQALARLHPGETAEVFGPLGAFLYDTARPAVFIAGGIGITPFRGMLRYAADVGAPEERRLLYSARIPEELVFKEELDNLALSDPRLKVKYSVTRAGESAVPWDGRSARADLAWIRQASEGLPAPKYYIAGLPEMVQEVNATLTGPLAVPDDDVDYEVFRGF